MQRKKMFFMLMTAGVMILFISGIALAFAQPAQAQCGSQASSCKSCHEVQGQMPVNNDGKPWHTSHAFGDFCYICHGGNNQAQDKASAHAGMVAPLSDIKASCQQCHPNDLDARAKVYADILGVQVGAAPASAGTTAAPAASSGTTAAPAAAQPVAGVPADTKIDVNDPNLVDYVKNYNEIVLGQRPINWGNVILLGLIVLVVVGGGGLVITNEKLVKISFGDTEKAEGEYPADVVEMLPQIASLKTGARKSLKSVLETKKAEKVLTLMDEVVKKDEE